MAGIYCQIRMDLFYTEHDHVIKWKHFPHYWPYVRGIHRWPVNSPHKGQWRGALMFALICAWTNGWVYHRDAGDWRCHHAHYDVTMMNFEDILKNSSFNTGWIKTQTCPRYGISLPFLMTSYGQLKVIQQLYFIFKVHHFNIELLNC